MTTIDTPSIASHAIPTPPDFLVAWERPEDAQIFWTLDQMHFPDQMPAFEYSVLHHAFKYGFNAAGAKYDAPIGAELRWINTYSYQAMGPLPLPPEELERRGHSAQERIGAVLGRFAELWRDEWEPELVDHVAYWRTFDLRGATLPQLIIHFDQTMRRIARAWEIHFEIAFPMLLGMSLFADVYADLFGAENTFDAYRLLQGFDNKSLETDRALWRFSRSAQANPAVRDILMHCADTEVLAALQGQPAAQLFLAELSAYLDEYGRRADKWNVISAPSWIEDPTPVIKNLKDYAAQPDRDITAESQRLAAEREQRLADIREQLRGYPQPVVGQFEFLLQAAQTATVLQEDHNFWIDQRCMYEVRRVAQEFGRRFTAAGVIDHAEDVFCLTIAELRAAAEALPQAAQQELVAQRKADLARFSTVAAPPVLGTLPAGAPPDDPFGRAIGRFFGGPPQPSSDPHTLRGNTGSPGVVRGVAKVVRSLREAAKLTKGDILVAETTAPPWTPLFATAAGIVTDAGGILSHCAIVAREYHIPAVVGAAGATTIIRDGMVIEIDGDAGIVRIVDEL
jgi:phosphohistidine swiveling domain-containing protein